MHYVSQNRAQPARFRSVIPATPLLFGKHRLEHRLLHNIRCIELRSQVTFQLSLR